MMAPLNEKPRPDMPLESAPCNHGKDAVFQVVFGRVEYGQLANLRCLRCGAQIHISCNRPMLKLPSLDEEHP
jgi:hypothetical protein